MCQELTLKCLGTPDTNTSDASKLQLVGCSAESGGAHGLDQSSQGIRDGGRGGVASRCAVITHDSSLTETQKDVRKTHICTTIPPSTVFGSVTIKRKTDTSELGRNVVHQGESLASTDKPLA